MTTTPHEIEDLFRDKRKFLIWKIFRMVSCQATAEDLVSEAFTRMVGLIDGKPIAQPSGFLHQTAHNLAIDHLRRERTRHRFLDIENGQAKSLQVASSEASPERVLEDRQQLARLTQSLSGLPERTRTVLLLNRIEGLSYPEISKRLGVSESTVYKDVRLALLHCLEAVGEE